MARKANRSAETPGIDRVETFLQSYYRQVIAFLAVVIIGAAAVYIGYSLFERNRMKKADLIGSLEGMLTTSEAVENYAKLSAQVPFLKNYIALSAAEAWAELGDNESALLESAAVGGSFEELGRSLAFDLGGDVNPEQYIKTGYMKPLWYYRMVMISKPEDRAANMERFRAAYPDYMLLKLLENWGM